MRAGRGHIIWSSDGTVRTKKGVQVKRYTTFRGRRYTLVGATGSKAEANRMAAGYRKRFGGAIVRRLEPGNFGIYAGGTFGK